MGNHIHSISGYHVPQIQPSRFQANSFSHWLPGLEVLTGLQIILHVPDHEEKYRVKFLDEEEYVITRDTFWTSEEDGFVRCALGEWGSAIKITDDAESGDGAGANDTSAQGFDNSALPPPPPADKFAGLSVRAQLAYAKDKHDERWVGEGGITKVGRHKRGYGCAIHQGGPKNHM